MFIYFGRLIGLTMVLLGIPIKWLYLLAVSVILIVGVAALLKITLTTKNNKSRYLTSPVKNKTILLVEQNSWHGEVLMPIAYLLLQLGYRVDVLCRTKIIKEGVFNELANPNLRIFKFEQNSIKELLSSKKVKKYDFVFFNSFEFAHTILNSHVFNYFNINYLPRNGFIAISHYPNSINFIPDKKTKFVSLIENHKNTNICFTTIAPLYPFPITPHRKNPQKINFIVVGNIDKNRKNYDLLVDALETLHHKKQFDLKVIVIGSGKLGKIPTHLRSYFDIKGRVSYPKMCDLLKGADYLLTLLDANDSRHNRYLNDGVTGSFANSFGFRIPCLVPRKFAKRFFWNKKNSLIIENNQTLAELMLQAINLDKKKYDAMVQELDKDCRQMQKRSLSNLGKLLK
jgi:hypothetical protein